MSEIDLLHMALDGLREGFAVFDLDSRMVHSNNRFHELMRSPQHLRLPGTRLETLAQMRAERGDFGEGVAETLTARWVERAQDPVAREQATEGDAIGTMLERFVPIPGRGLLVTLTDHTRVAEAEAKIARMAKFPDENPGPVLRFDRNNDLTYANPAGLDLCNRVGCTRVGESAPPDWLEHFETARAQGVPAKVELRRAGATYSLLFCPVSDTDEINCYGQNITERIRHSEELARARDAANLANKTKSQFLANMSHELRTPMNAIMGFTKLVMRRSKHVLEPTQLNNLDKVLTSANHLLTLINNILDLSKIEAGGFDVSPSWFSLGDVLELCLRTIEPLMKDGVELEASVSSALPEMLADEIKVKQILFNLLSNAAKFTREGSVTVDASHADDVVTIAVTDTGIGIGEGAMADIFKEFSQGDESSTREFGGTGLGLAISLRLARLMGGDIEVTSTLGEGTTFTITLPLRYEGAPAREGLRATPIAEPQTHATMPLILAIDDDENALRLVQENLGESGFRVVIATNGDEGLRKARLLKPSAITLDVVMGTSDGWQVLHALKSDPETKDIPVIMLTVLEQQSLAFRLGAAQYLTKPVKRADLMASVRRSTDARARVLVVDDSPDVLSLLRQILEDEGHIMIAATNGEEGLARIEDSAPDVVVLDLMMPILDGFGLLDRLWATDSHPDLPVVILTAKVLTAAEEQALKNRTQMILRKRDLQDDSLIQQIEAVLGRPPSLQGRP